METQVRSRRVRTASFVAAFLVAAAVPALAQDSTGEVKVNPVDPDFKGTIGLGLVGAELGFVIPAVAGARDAWAYIVFPILGAGGGGAAGYFAIEKGTDSAELAVASLVTGMALIIPAMVVTLSATAYDPDEEMPARAGGAPPALVRLDDAKLRVGAPGVAFAPDLEAREALRIGARPERQLRVSLVAGRF